MWRIVCLCAKWCSEFTICLSKYQLLWRADVLLLLFCCFWFLYFCMSSHVHFVAIGEPSGPAGSPHVKATEKHKSQSLAVTWFGSVGGSTLRYLLSKHWRKLFFPSWYSLTPHTVLTLSQPSSNIYTVSPHTSIWTSSVLASGSVDNLSISDKLGSLFFSPLSLFCQPIIHLMLMTR